MRNALASACHKPHVDADLVRPSLDRLLLLIRRVAIAPALIGGLLWNVTPALPFWMARAPGLVGVILFVATVEERHAS